MTYQALDLTPGAGDTGIGGGTKINANFVELYTGFVGKNNATTTDPGVSNDNTQGYAAGSTWFNSSTGAAWKCQSAGTGAAVWLRQDYSDHPGMVAGNFYLPLVTTITTGTALAINVARYFPFIPKQDFTASALLARVTTIGSTNFQLAVYASDPTTKRPTGLPLASTGNMLNTSTGIVTSGAISQVFQAGVLYYLAINNGDSTAVFAVGPVNGYVSWLLGSSNSTNVLLSQVAALSTPMTFGTWSDVTAASWTEIINTAYALIAVKVGSVP